MDMESVNSGDALVLLQEAIERAMAMLDEFVRHGGDTGNERAVDNLRIALHNADGLAGDLVP